MVDKIIRIVLDTRQAEAGASRVRRELHEVDRASGTAKSSISGLTVAFQALNTIMAGMTAGRFFSQFNETVGDFQKSMASVRAVTGATAEEIAKLERFARNLAAVTPKTPGEVADAMYKLGMAGLKTKDILVALPGVLDLSIAGLVDMARAAEISVNQIMAFGMNMEDVNQVGDVFLKMAVNATTDVNQLADAMKFAAPIADALGRDLHETAAAIAFLSNRSIQADMAGTALRNIMLELIEPSKALKQAFKNVGKDFDDVKISSMSLAEIFKMLKGLGVDIETIFTFFEKRAAGAAKILIEGAYSYEEFVKKTADFEGTAKHIATIMQDSIPGAAKTLSSAVDELMLVIGDAGLSKALRDLIDTATGVVRVWISMNDPLDKTTEKFKAMANAVETLGTALLLISGAATLHGIVMIGQALGPWGVALGVAALGIGAVVGYKDEIEAMFAPIQKQIEAWNADAAAIYKVKGSLEEMYESTRKMRTFEDTETRLQEIVAVTGKEYSAATATLKKMFGDMPPEVLKERIQQSNARMAYLKAINELKLFYETGMSTEQRIESIRPTALSIEEMVRGVQPVTPPVVGPDLEEIKAKQKYAQYAKDLEDMEFDLQMSLSAIHLDGVDKRIRQEEIETTRRIREVNYRIKDIEADETLYSDQRKELAEKMQGSLALIEKEGAARIAEIRKSAAAEQLENAKREAEYYKSQLDPDFAASEQVRKVQDVYQKGLISSQVYDRALKVIEDQRIRAQVQILRQSGDAWSGAKAAMMEYVQAAKDASETFYQVWVNAIRKLEDMFVELFKTGKMDIRSFLESFSTDVLRAAVRQNITGPLMQSMQIYAAPNANPLGGSFGAGMGSGMIQNFLPMVQSGISSLSNFFGSFLGNFDQGGVSRGKGWISTEVDELHIPIQKIKESKKLQTVFRNTSLMDIRSFLESFSTVTGPLMQSMQIYAAPNANPLGGSFGAGMGSGMIQNFLPMVQSGISSLSNFFGSFLGNFDQGGVSRGKGWISTEVDELHIPIQKIKESKELQTVFRNTSLREYFEKDRTVEKNNLERISTDRYVENNNSASRTVENNNTVDRYVEKQINNTTSVVGRDSAVNVIVPPVPIIPRQAGGPVLPGNVYLTGEKGPEIIVPKQAGTVLPNFILQLLERLGQPGRPAYSGGAALRQSPIFQTMTAMSGAFLGLSGVAFPAMRDMPSVMSNPIQQAIQRFGSVMNPLHRETGGALQPGNVYLTGEKGPEILIPNQPGTVLPNNLTRALGMLGNRMDDMARWRPAASSIQEKNETRIDKIEVHNTYVNGNRKPAPPSRQASPNRRQVVQDLVSMLTAGGI